MSDSVTSLPQEQAPPPDKPPLSPVTVQTRSCTLGGADVVVVEEKQVGQQVGIPAPTWARALIASFGLLGVAGGAVACFSCGFVYFEPTIENTVDLDFGLKSPFDQTLRGQMGLFEYSLQEPVSTSCRAYTSNQTAGIAWTGPLHLIAQISSIVAPLLGLLALLVRFGSSFAKHDARTTWKASSLLWLLAFGGQTLTFLVVLDLASVCFASDADCTLYAGGWAASAATFGYAIAFVLSLVFPTMKLPSSNTTRNNMGTSTSIVLDTPEKSSSSVSCPVDYLEYIQEEEEEHEEMNHMEEGRVLVHDNQAQDDGDDEEEASTVVDRNLQRMDESSRQLILLPHLNTHDMNVGTSFVVPLAPRGSREKTNAFFEEQEGVSVGVGPSFEEHPSTYDRATSTNPHDLALQDSHSEDLVCFQDDEDEDDFEEIQLAAPVATMPDDNANAEDQDEDAEADPYDLGDYRARSRRSMQAQGRIRGRNPWEEYLEKQNRMEHEDGPHKHPSWIGYDQ